MTKQPLVKLESIIIPPLHIKLGLVSQFLKTIIKNGNEEVVQFLINKFSITSEKAKSGILNGPKINKLFCDTNFENLLNQDEKNAFSAFRSVCEQFLGNRKEQNFEEIVRNMLQCFSNLNVNVSLKIHLLICHLHRFPDNCGDFSDEHGEKFHQTLKKFQDRFKSKNTDVKMLSAYHFTIKKYESSVSHSRKSNYKTF